VRTLILTSGLTMSSFLISCHRYDGHMGDYGHMMNYPYGGIFMWIIILVITGLIGFGVFYFFRKGKTTKDETPLEILQKRYAKGEISKEEYEDIKNTL